MSTRSFQAARPRDVRVIEGVGRLSSTSTKHNRRRRCDNADEQDEPEVDVVDRGSPSSIVGSVGSDARRCVIVFTRAMLSAAHSSSSRSMAPDRQGVAAIRLFSPPPIAGVVKTSCNCIMQDTT
jgi:hypothetical protein